MLRVSSNMLTWIWWWILRKMIRMILVVGWASFCDTWSLVDTVLLSRSSMRLHLSILVCSLFMTRFWVRYVMLVSLEGFASLDMSSFASLNACVIDFDSWSSNNLRDGWWTGVSFSAEPALTAARRTIHFRALWWLCKVFWSVVAYALFSSCGRITWDEVWCSCASLFTLHCYRERVYSVLRLSSCLFLGIILSWWGVVIDESWSH